MSRTILHIDSSARLTGSVTRDLGQRIAARLGGRTVHRDLATHPVPQIDEGWVTANFTPAEARTEAQNTVLRLSDTLVAELEEADILVIGLPIYNFGVPSALKAWIDQVARAGRTFRYTDAGPRGLLQGKRAIVAVASGGTEAGSEIDFATGYLRHVLGFIGITDIEFVTADRLAIDPDATLSSAEAQLDALDLAA